jgi:TolB-like protein/tetratricopeptide (TPR) repeat protein
MSDRPPPASGPGAARPAILQRALAELRRRKMPQSVAVYVVGAWLVLQVADLAFPGLGVPEEAIRYVWIGVLAGFPLVFFFAWGYQITADGVVRTPPRKTPGDDSGAEAVRLGPPDRIVLGALALAGVLIALPLIGAIAESRGTPYGGLPRNALAVLPFQNVTGDAEQEYLAAGLQDALITTLSRVSALTVKASSSTGVYRNVVQPVGQTARELAARHVIEGSVFRDVDLVQINVRLIDAVSEQTIWSESYQRPIEDVLTLQNEIARTVAGAIRVKLTPDEEEHLASTRKVDPEVYETYLRGMYHLNQFTPQGVETGMAYLQQAVELGPDDPLAFAGLALGYTLIGHSANPPPGAFAAGREAAVRALELDPLFPEAHAALAEIRFYYDWDWAGAQASFRRALQLNPNLELSHGHYAWLLQLGGDMDGAIRHMRRAQQIAPLTPIFTTWLGALYLGDGQYERAGAEARRALEVNPDFPWGIYLLGRAYAAEGLHDEALATFRRLKSLHPSLGRWGLGFTFAAMGRERDAHQIVAELAEAPGQKDILMIGLLYGALGDEERAMDWLERAYDERVDWLPAAGVPPGWDNFVRAGLEPLTDNPRYLRLVERLALPAPGEMAGSGRGRPRAP